MTTAYPDLGNPHAVGSRLRPARGERRKRVGDLEVATIMPMIDVYATGTFADPHALAASLAKALMKIEQVSDIPML